MRYVALLLKRNAAFISNQTLFQILDKPHIEADSRTKIAHGHTLIRAMDAGKIGDLLMVGTEAKNGIGDGEEMAGIGGAGHDIGRNGDTVRRRDRV